MGYQFFEFQSSRSNQINCALMRIRVDDRTVDVQFFFIDVHQGEGNGGADLRYAEQKNRPTRPGTFDCLKCCLRIADALNNGVGAVRAKNLTDLFRKTFVDRINDRVCANLCSDFSPDCDRLTQKHVCCATQLGQLHHQESNRAASDHKNVAAGADTGLINAVYRTGKRFDHRSCVQVGILRQHEALCLRQNAEFRKAAIRVDTQRKHMFKSFGPTKALVDVELEVNRGEIRGLIGENGSGKSTISSIVAGVQPYDSGEMFFKGEPYKPTSMIEAQAKGIAMVVQEMGTISNITVAANIFIGKEKLFCKGPFLSVKKMNEAAKKILVEIGADHIDPAAPINDLNFEDRKIVEIARAMYDHPEIFIVDETTTALSQRGRDIVYNIMRKLSSEKKAVLFISHDLDELMSICNAITVLRDGILVATMEREEMEVNKMRTYMVGREISDDYYRTDFDGSYDDEVVLTATNVTAGAVLENFSFELHKGEILGFGGLSECGMHELGKAVFGAEQLITGSIVLKNGTHITNPQQAIRNKIAYMSKNRDQEAIILNDTIGNNIVLPSIPMLEKATYVSPKAERELAQQEIKSMSIKCQGPQQYVSELSGGNKQKVVFAKWIGNKSDILILDCPTRGIDIGVKVAMYQLMYRLKKEGKSIIMISEELPELIGMSDRIMVLKDGQLTHTFTRSADLKETDVIHYMI